MKRIIVLCDGTWLDSDGGSKEDPSNVTRLARALNSQASDGQPLQVISYHAGLGTGVLDKTIGGGIGVGIEENIREGYSFIANNYAPGDEIHLFGFSRGAYTARAICGMVCRIGVLSKHGLEDFYSIYQKYRTKAYRDDAELKALQAQEGGSLVHSNVKVKTIGCFDTVGSLGIPTVNWSFISRFISGRNSKDYEFLDTDLYDNVEHAFHAMALDEHRYPFLPTIWTKSKGSVNTTLKQCWFPGVHMSVGGGDKKDGQELADITLAWMIKETSPFLSYDIPYIKNYMLNGTEIHKEWALGEFKDSMTTFYRIAGVAHRTPGEYGPVDHTEEFVHASVRVRMTKNPTWWKACTAMKGWDWQDKENCWKKGEIRLEEDELGDVEKDLAGRDLVVKLLGASMPRSS